MRTKYNSIFTEYRISPHAKGAKAALNELFRYSDLLQSWIKRDWLLRYNQSPLGWLWLALQPLGTALLLGFVFGLTLKPHSAEMPMGLFIVSGWSCWFFMQSSSQQSLQAFGQYQSMFKKVYFPKMLLPLAKTLGLLPELWVGLMCTLLWAGFGRHLNPSAWLVFLPVVWAVVHSWSFSTLAFALGGSYRDVQFIWPYLLQMLFFLSPVIYPFGLLGTHLPEYVQALLFLNPLCGAMEAFRFFCFEGYVFNPNIWISLAAQPFWLLVTWWVYRKQEPKWLDAL